MESEDGAGQAKKKAGSDTSRSAVTCCCVPGGRIRLHDLSLEFVKDQASRCGSETALHQDLSFNNHSQLGLSRVTFWGGYCLKELIANYGLVLQVRARLLLSRVAESLDLL